MQPGNNWVDLNDWLKIVVANQMTEILTQFISG